MLRAAIRYGRLADPLILHALIAAIRHRHQPRQRADLPPIPETSACRTAPHCTWSRLSRRSRAAAICCATSATRGAPCATVAARSARNVVQARLDRLQMRPLARPAARADAAGSGRPSPVCTRLEARGEAARQRHAGSLVSPASPWMRLRTRVRSCRTVVDFARQLPRRFRLRRRHVHHTPHLRARPPPTAATATATCRRRGDPSWPAARGDSPRYSTNPPPRWSTPCAPNHRCSQNPSRPAS